MRITNSMMTNKFLSEANSALNRVAKYQSQVNSTKRLSGIADDPHSTLMALKARNRLSNLELYQSNIATANSYLKEAESATSALNKLLQSAYEDVISAQSAKTPDDLKILAENIKNLQNEAYSISNTSLGTSYIFGGFNFTGSTDGSKTYAPFTIDDVTGDLSYNGINLAKIAWKEDYDTAIKQMTDQMLTDAKDKTDLRSIASEFNDEYSTYTDIYAKSEGQKILSSLNTILAGAEDAMTAAEEYGINSGTSEYETFKTFYDNLTAVKDELQNELSKEFLGDYILDTEVPLDDEYRLADGTIDYEYYKNQGMNVYTAAERDNLLGSIKFNKTRINSILNGEMFPLLTGSGAGNFSDMTDAIQTLSAVVTTPDNATDFAESIKRVTAQTDGTDLTALIDAYDPASDDPDAREHAQKILSPLKSIVANAKKAIELAGTYGAASAAFNTFTTTLSDYADDLESEIDNSAVNKPVIGTILNDVETLLASSATVITDITNAVAGGTPPNTTNVVSEAGNKPLLQIGSSQTADLTVTGLELLGVGKDNIYHILGKAVSMLSSGKAKPEDLSKMITQLQGAQSNVLTLQTRIGATQNRMTLLGGRYDSSELNYTEMRSMAEDVDMAEAIINLTEAQTVYNAALAGGAEILKTSLMDFLR